ncbi:MvdC/MvdD family ATP grasp protein [Streptomyces sp. NPDC013171]|uniref:MvdC/MvdD family ATP grasp protein n=1 Tax=Streptomyces sp. NPDC013171 TaxID=3364863 RepID=UPI0036A96523
MAKPPVGPGTRGGVPPRVLVVTYALDPTADYVLQELNERGIPFWRTDLADFPTRSRLRATLGPSGRWQGVMHDDARGVDLSELRAVWWRKPTTFAFADTMGESEQRFARSQAKHAVAVLSSLPDVLWVNRPERNADCTKPVQLAVAVESGLHVPDTLITNDPADVAAFAAEVGGPIITKVLGGIVHTEDGKRGQLYTRRVPPEQYLDPRIGLTAHLFQREITVKAYEIRVTAVGDQLYAAKIYAPAGPGQLDWRRDSRNLTYAVATVPGYIRDGIREMMHRLGLIYAALDFIVDRNGAHWLVDVNPAGQWAWIDCTRDAITQALADLLEKGSP